MLLFISGSEIFIIILAVLLLFGANKIPEILRGLGKGYKEFKKATDDIRSEFEEHTSDIKNEMNDLKKNVKEYTEFEEIDKKEDEKEDEKKEDEKEDSSKQEDKTGNKKQQKSDNSEKENKQIPDNDPYGLDE